MVIRYIPVLALILCFSTSYAEEIVKIPLSEIWANGMPGTKKFGEFKCNPAQDRDCPSSYKILQAIQYPKKGVPSLPGFAVAATGLEAMREARRIIVDKAPPSDSFSTESDITIVFFTHEIHPYVELLEAEVSKNAINVHYKFVPHETEDMSFYLALIPLVKLKSGKYEVNFLLSELDPKYAGSSFERNKDEIARVCVCGEFSFSVSEQGD